MQSVVRLEWEWVYRVLRGMRVTGSGVFWGGLGWCSKSSGFTMMPR